MPRLFDDEFLLAASLALSILTTLLTYRDPSSFVRHMHAIPCCIRSTTSSRSIMGWSCASASSEAGNETEWTLVSVGMVGAGPQVGLFLRDLSRIMTSDEMPCLKIDR